MRVGMKGTLFILIISGRAVESMNLSDFDSSPDSDLRILALDSGSTSTLA